MSRPLVHTVGGLAIDLLEPDYSDLTIEEVAHSLGRINRFSGHTHTPYNVAQHSLYVAAHLPEWLQLPGLGHDGHESVIGDWTSPVKAAIRALGGAKALRRLDRLHSRAFHDRFMPNVPRHHERVKIADQRAGATEIRDLMPNPWRVTWRGAPMLPYRDRIDYVMSPQEAEGAFLKRYRELTSPSRIPPAT